MHDFAGCRMIFDSIDQLNDYRSYMRSPSVTKNVKHELRYPAENTTILRTQSQLAIEVFTTCTGTCLAAVSARKVRSPGMDCWLRFSTERARSMLTQAHASSLPLATMRPCPRPVTTTIPRGPSWCCARWAGPAWGDSSMADCRQGGVASCQANAANGCVHWMRETGVDDDGWAPVPLPRSKSPADKPFEMTPELYAVVRQIQADLDRRV